MRTITFRTPLGALGIVGATIVFAISGAASAAVQPSGLPTLTLALTGKTITVGGTLQSGAVDVETTVAGEPFGGPTLFRLNDGVSFDAFALAAQSVNSHNGDPNYLDAFGSLVFSQGVRRGTGDAEVVLPPGNYIALDLSGNVRTPPHVAFTVTAATAPPPPPPVPKVTVQAIEFGFRSPAKLHHGELVQFYNGGFVVHMIEALRVRNLRNARKLTALLREGRNRQADKLVTAVWPFAYALSSRAAEQQIVAAPPGVYVLACFMNTQDGRPNTELGMEKTVRILR